MMQHNNKIQDTEPRFIIDPLNRTITNTSADNNIIVQYDHNSERFTFEIPRYVDGHDMSECKENGEVRINYRNSASTGLARNNGYYICEDLAISDEDENKVTFSWLLSSAATQYIGFLYFSIQFICYDEENLIYSWNTGIYKDIVIVESINNVEEIVASDSFKELNDLIVDANDVITRGNEVVEEANATVKEATDVIEEVNATLGECVETVEVIKQSPIMTVDGTPLRYFVGTKAKYNTLSDEDKVNLYAVITDDMTKDELAHAIEDLIDATETLRGDLSHLEDDLTEGVMKVGKAAKADSATNADKVTNGYYRSRVLSTWKELAGVEGSYFSGYYTGAVTADDYVVIRYGVAPNGGDWSYFETPPIKAYSTTDGGLFTLRPVYVPIHVKNKNPFNEDGKIVTGYVGFDVNTSYVGVHCEEVTGGNVVLLGAFVQS